MQVACWWGVLLLSGSVAAYYSDAVDLTRVPTLTFFSGRFTTFRRTEAVPQLQCVKGTGCHLGYLVKTVQCNNMGASSDGNVRWTCTADLDARVVFGRTDVVCEGYSSTPDHWKLRGSCGLEYELWLTKKTTTNPTSLPSVLVYPPPPTFISAGPNIFWAVSFFVLVLLVVLVAASAEPNPAIRPVPVHPIPVIYPVPVVQPVIHPVPRQHTTTGFGETRDRANPVSAPAYTPPPPDYTPPYLDGRGPLPVNTVVGQGETRNRSAIVVDKKESCNRSTTVVDEEESRNYHRPSSGHGETRNRFEQVESQHPGHGETRNRLDIVEQVESRNRHCPSYGHGEPRNRLVEQEESQHSGQGETRNR